MKLILTLTLILAASICSADEETFNMTFVGHCYNYALATGYADEYSYELKFATEQTLKESQEVLAEYFTLEQQSQELNYIITYRSDISPDESLEGALLVDSILDSKLATANCVFVKR